ncbi:hypothetical protein Gasu2_65160 [Galdieria sulphuraria]|nr:hypothetical protein Gasu2_65160 [Galdieria sulphuraria]
MLDELVTIFWLVALVAYACKYFYPTWSHIISYGRIVDREEEEKCKILQRNNMTVQKGNLSLMEKTLSGLLSYLLSSRIEYRTGFTHFYGIGCIASLVLFYFQNFHGIEKARRGNVVCSSWLFLLHTSRRLYESLFMQVYSKRKMHLLHWFAGTSYYLFAACTFCWHDDHPYWSLSKGWLALHLAQLRRKDGTDNKRYYIPYRGLFRYVVCPHYMLEIIIYGVLVLGKGGSRNSFLNFVFVVLNLTSRSIECWHWYQSYFGIECVNSHWHILIPWLW